jgi:hypothetical protein
MGDKKFKLRISSGYTKTRRSSGRKKRFKIRSEFDREDREGGD